MKSLEMLPTLENLKSTYQNDSIGRNADVHSFVKLLNSISGSFSIALNGAWGSGKTFFVKQVKMVMDSLNEAILNDLSDIKDYHGSLSFDVRSQVVVYYDAWENDKDDDPALSLIYRILQDVDSDFSFNDGIDRFRNIANETIKALSSIDIKKLSEKNDIFDELKSSRKLDEKINEYFDWLLLERGERIVVIIDELDRCRPDFAVRLLERIKHYFLNEKVTFVFSVNIKELQHTIKRFYGELDAVRYLDRFFDLRMDLPPANMAKYYAHIGFVETRGIFDQVRMAVVKKYGFSLRETARYYYGSEKTMGRIAKAGQLDFFDAKTVALMTQVFAPIMMGLKMHSIQAYEEFVLGATPQPLIDVVSSIQPTILSYFISDDTPIQNDPVKIIEYMKRAYNMFFQTVGAGVAYNNARPWLERVVGMFHSGFDCD